MRSVKQYTKRGLQHCAARLGPHTRHYGPPRLLVLMYHRVLPAGDKRLDSEEPGMYVTPQTFSNHLKWLSEYFVFTRLYEWIKQKSSGGTLPARACAITFDDGWADNYEHAFPALREAQIPATIFLVSDLIGSRQTFWPERLARLLQRLSGSPGSGDQPEHQWLQPLIPPGALAGPCPPETAQAT